MNEKTGSICGGIIRQSEFDRRLKEGTVEGVMMAFVMPDNEFDAYIKLREVGETKKAQDLFNRFAWSII